MKNKFLSVLGVFCLLCTSQVWGTISEGSTWYDVENSPRVYFANLYWSSSNPAHKVGLLIGRNWTYDKNPNYGEGSQAENLTKIANTNLWTHKFSEWKHFNDMLFIRFDCDNCWKDWSGTHVASRYSHAQGWTNKYNTNMNGGYHLFVPSSGSNEAAVSHENDADYTKILHKKQSIVVLLSTDNGSHYYESNINYGSFAAQYYQMTSSTSASQTSSSIENNVSALITSSITFTESNTTEGFMFQGWKTSREGEIQTGNLTYTVDGEETIYACFTGPDTNLPKVYFDNTLGWGSVWVHFYESAYWNLEKGTGTKGIYHSCIPMTKMDDSNIWYFAYPFDKKSDIIAFTSAEQKGYEFFHECNAAYRGDFSSSKPVFVPCPGISATLNTSTNYYNKGYWKTLDEHYQYYLKNTWATADNWTWKKMATEDGVTYTLTDVGYTNGKGYNYNFLDEEVGKSTYIENYTKVGVLETGDKVNIEFTPANGQIRVTLIPTDLNVTIGSTGYATYYYSKPYVIPAGVTAQYITAVDERALTNTFLKEGDVIPANEGVILHGEQGEYTFGGTTDVPEALSSNMLKGTLVATDIDNELVHYIMTLNDQSKVGLFWPYGTTEGVGSFNNGAHKAYLEIPAGTSAPHRIGYAFDEAQTPTGVVEVNENANKNRKVMINNQLIIIREGKLYNAQGICL